jgi:hypothetical protein
MLNIETDDPTTILAEYKDVEITKQLLLQDLYVEEVTFAKYEQNLALYENVLETSKHYWHKYEYLAYYKKSNNKHEDYRKLLMLSNRLSGILQYEDYEDDDEDNSTIHYKINEQFDEHNSFFGNPENKLILIKLANETLQRYTKKKLVPSYMT